MRFGLALPHYDFSVPGEGASFSTTSAWVVKAESLGFDSVWVSDHFAYSFARYGEPGLKYGSLEPMTTLAGLAASTQRVRLGTLVLGAPFRHPSLLAKMAATIDVVSGGRLDLGLGAGWFADEFEAFGYPFGSVGDRFGSLEETLRVLTALFGDEPASLLAGHVELRQARLSPRPAQTPGPPLWVGGKGGDRLLGLAARYATGWNSVWRWTPADFGRRAAAARVACEAIGRDPATFRFSVGLYGLLAEDEPSMDALWRRAQEAMPGRALNGETLQDWCSDTLSGTPERVLELIRDWEEVGVEELILSPWTLPFAIHEPEIVELFAERVMAPHRAG